MEREIQTAVEWWAKQLAGKTKQDNGDDMCNIFHAVASEGLKPPTSEQIEMFKKSLTERLKEELPRTWKPRDPNWGSGCGGRCLAVDYHPDLILRDAANDAGIDGHSLRFPMKTVMWISPGLVKVSHGYCAKAEELLKE